jgi:hypothetical protein
MDNKEVIHNEKKTMILSKKFFGVGLIFGLIILAFLYMNFNFTYQFRGNESAVMDKAEEVLVKQHEVMEKKTIIEPVIQKREEKVSCTSLLDFVKDYYKFRLQLDNGNEFSKEIAALSHYKINSSEINQYLSNIVVLAPNYKYKGYFSLRFNSLIKDIYDMSQHQQSFLHRYLGKYLQQLIFIRPVGERAIRNDGIDMNIALVEDSFNRNDLLKAKIYIAKLPDNLESLKVLQLELENQILINDSLSVLDRLIADKIDCNMVSK